ncbi:transcription factor Cmr1 [Aaosphaeria arxii CBS 175.79]|uniref:Transcription factor Cmr1 n=1 Tax=Aaosphaeria arxii CBS 175.79 TaxID=1450172 RepID=A0A6A5XZK7_9PLEO|nr:transcription factor Cmr1 [Aaosphaeria arxii CBS 175.79]KAF2018419.1 transcription factor Cmr1 [Aaosphaeria arxii CBS 175.79]
MPDLLQRHYTVHGRDQNNQEGIQPTSLIPKSAGRTPIACSNCAKTKTKCDKKFPCSRCESRNLRCTLRPTRRASKNLNRAIPPEEPQASGASSERGNSNRGSQSVSGGNSPVREVKPPADSQAVTNSKLSPGQSQPILNGQALPQQQQQQQQHAPPSQLPLSTPPSMTHSRTSSVSQPMQLHIPTPAASDGKPNIHNPQATTPPLFDQSPTASFPMAPQQLLSPGAPLNGFISQTPMSGYEEFAQTVREPTDHDCIPPTYGFMDPWSMPVGNEFENMRIDPTMMMSMNIDMNMVPPTDPMLGILPEMSPPQGFGPVQTPLQTPRVDESFSDLQLGSSASMFYPNSRQSSITEDRVPDLGAIVAAQDGWTVFRCTPQISSSHCPRTAKLNLERLEDSLKNSSLWAKWTPTWDESDFRLGEPVSVMPLHEATRDKLLAITQGFLHKALEIHKDGASSSPSSGSSPTSIASNFILLPPCRVLECFLRSYANSFERFFPMSSRGLIEPNELMTNYNDKAASLFLLMMIAQGAMAMPFAEARWLTGGLTEACRISLFDLIEKNIIMASDNIVLRAALLFTVQAAWSGDKWQMDIAMGQRGMYFAMLRHSGVLEPRQASDLHTNGAATVDTIWQDWLSKESESRLVYSWAMVDQDLSLFHDTAPLFAVTEFKAPMPDADRLWQSKSATDWAEVFNHVHEFSNGYPSVGSGVRPLSLRDLFRHFLDDTIVSQDIHLTPLHLRLLLHPLQSMVCQYCQLLSCFSMESIGTRKGSRAVTAASTRVRLEEVQSLLQRWLDLTERYLKSNPMCPMLQASIVMYHLINLNAVTNFPEIERLARKENADPMFQSTTFVQQKCIYDVHEAAVHCGQVLRLTRDMPLAIRPPWWPGAMYRVALILWALAAIHKEIVAPVHQASATFPVEVLPVEHPAVVRYLTTREGTPMLSRLDGSPMPIDDPFQVVLHCIEVIGAGIATRFSDGIRSKLEKFARA